MGLIREPKDVDFFVDPKPLTDEERKMISDYIKKDKQRRKLRERKGKKVRTRNTAYKP
jgi:hypothetical protein